MTPDVESAVNQVYAEAADFFSRLAPAPHYGFKLLNSPPRFRPCFAVLALGGISAVSAGGKVDHLPESQGTSAARSKI